MENFISSHFSALKDPRQSWKVLYPLEELLLLSVAGTLAGADGFVEIIEWGGEHLDFLRRFYPYDNGMPSHDCLNDLFNTLDGDLLQDCFVSWISKLQEHDAEIIAIDGKTSRRSHNGKTGKAALHTVSAWACKQRLVLGQQSVDDKSNEITAIPLLLQRLCLQGALVTIDAMGTQHAIAKDIVKAGADYLLALKANRKSLYDEAVMFFNDKENKIDDFHETIDGDHGRIETRRHYISHDVSWLHGSKNAQAEPNFPHLSAIGMVENHIERDGKIQISYRYYLCSCPLDAESFAKAVRAHWGIENRLHWVMDVVFHDDLSRVRTGFGAQNMVTLRHIARNLIEQTGESTMSKRKQSLRVRRKRAGWSTQYLEAVIRGNA